MSVETEPIQSVQTPVETPRRDLWPLAANVLAWSVVAVILLAVGAWAARTGIQLRHDLWANSRTIRFKGDIINGYRRGWDVMRTAESAAGLPTNSDALAFTHAGDPKARQLTIRDIWLGIMINYDETAGQGDADYGLDYLPLRLMTMTLWVRSVERLGARDRDGFPRGGWPKSDDPSPQPEDDAQPLLDMNTICEGIAAIVMLALVWIWVGRWHGANEIVQPAWVWPKWMLAFLVASIGFWYSLQTSIGPPPRPTPMVQITNVATANNAVTVHGIVNGQEQPGRWRIQWGVTPAMERKSSIHGASESTLDVVITSQLRPVHTGDTVYLRLVATSNGFSSDTDVIQYTVGDPPLTVDQPASGGLAWPDWTVWMRMLALFTIMVATARALPLPHRGWACGLLAALLVWFDPITLINSHVWPQWDVWILPFIVSAILFATLDMWVAAGLLIGVGAMFKGQMLLGCGVLIIWPLFSGRIGATLRIAAGIALGAGFVVWPMILSTVDPHNQLRNYAAPDPVHWVIDAMVAAVLMAAASRLLPILWRAGKQHLLSPKSVTMKNTILLLGSALLIDAAWKLTLFLLHRHVPAAELSDPLLLWLTLAIILVPWILRGRFLGYWLVIVMAAVVWTAPALFNGDFAWKAVGIDYGSIKFPIMAMGNMSFSNLPQLLNLKYRWDLSDIIGTFSWGHPGDSATATDLDAKTTMSWAYGILLVFCGIAAAIQGRRKDPRTLLALSLPWLLFTMFMGQMSERYLLWFSALSAAMVGVSVGLSLLHVLLAIMAGGMIAAQLMTQYGDPGRWPGVNDFFIHNYPEIAWLMVLLTALYFVTMFLPSRKEIDRQDAKTPS